MPADRTGPMVLSGHRDRMRSLDPLLPEPGPLPDAGDNDPRLIVAGAVGLSRRILVDPNSPAATAGALDQRWLFARVTSPATAR